MSVTGRHRQIQGAITGYYGSFFATADTGPLLYKPFPGEPEINLVLMNPDGSQHMLAQGHAFASPRFSSDGKSVAVGIRYDKNKPAILIYDTDSGSSFRFTDFGEFPVWSPDGNTIAFFEAKTGAVQSGSDGLGQR
ncbi:MAG TPA: hypothetical protein EYG51_03805 [Pseudomonadales bacterium]|nr:hypothetical protein [Pseudomonadales bacterium]